MGLERYSERIVSIHHLCRTLNLEFTLKGGKDKSLSEHDNRPELIISDVAIGQDVYANSDHNMQGMINEAYHYLVGEVRSRMNERINDA